MEGGEEEEEEGDSELWDLLRPLEGDCEVEFATFQDKDVTATK